MARRLIHEAKIAEVYIEEEGAPPRPPVVPPSPIISAFLDEHRKLKGIIERHGKNGLCVARDTLESEGNVTEEKRMDQHILKFKEHDVFSEVSKDVFCGKSALKEFKKTLKMNL